MPLLIPVKSRATLSLKGQFIIAIIWKNYWCMGREFMAIHRHVVGFSFSSRLARQNKTEILTRVVPFTDFDMVLLDNIIANGVHMACIG
jgi:hypothetical protein